MKRITILGSTGSIGRNALDVVRNLPGRFKVRALSTNSNIDILYTQIKEFHPEFVCVKDLQAAFKLKKRSCGKTKILVSEDGLLEVSGIKDVDCVLLAISGSAALKPLLRAIGRGVDIALANKEALVMAGEIVMAEARKKKVNILPIDSEQSAIWQCLGKGNESKVKSIYLTASGGPFRNTRKQDFKNISIGRVLKHPRWSMGTKITVDSATLMNKGFEVIEAKVLFDEPLEKIKVLVHPEAIIHSMVEFVDGVIMAQLSDTDMRIPIQYALTFPERLESKSNRIDFCKLGSLNFEAPDLNKFPALGLAYQAARLGGTMTVVLNAANEISVEAFLESRLKFIDIPKAVEKVMLKHRNNVNPELRDILETDTWARFQTQDMIRNLN